MGEYDGGELRRKAKIDKASLQTGTDEWGHRIKFHTASLSCEQAMESGLGHFVYTGETIASRDADESTTESVTDAAGVAGRLESGRSRHGHGEIKYDGERWVIVDTNSSNGTMINGVACAPKGTRGPRGPALRRRIPD